MEILNRLKTSTTLWAWILVYIGASVFLYLDKISGEVWVTAVVVKGGEYIWKEVQRKKIESNEANRQGN